MINHKFIIVILISVVLIILIYLFLKSNNYENMITINNILSNESNKPITYCRDDNCEYIINESLKKILNEYNIKKSKSIEDCMLHLPCTYNNIKKEIKNVNPANNDQRIFILSDCNQLTGKDSVWKNLVKYFGRSMAKTIMPESYVLSNVDDMKLFEKDFNSNKLYILKKNVQRQLGLKITNDLNEIKNAKNNNYVIVQKLLDNPYLIDERKINLRFYLLILCENNELDAYVYNNGFMYYTKDKYVNNSKETGPNITTGYIDRDVYKKNPLTHSDFKKYLNLQHGYIISDDVFNDIYNHIKLVTIAVSDVICKNNKFKNNIYFQLFGVDVSLDKNLKPHIIEINKGPDLGAKDERDKKIKFNLIKSMLKLLKLIPDDNKNNFIKILE